MLLNAYSIYDIKALQYHPPYFASTDAAAARAFGDLANDLNTHVGRHPADYILYCVGTFLDSTGQLEPISPRRHVADAASFIRHTPVDLFQNGEAQTLANGSK